jgi:hypothetical protein
MSSRAYPSRSLSMTKKSGRSLAVAAAMAVTAASIAVAIGPATAAAAGPATRARTVWVDARGVSSVWHVSAAAAFVDRYTGTRLRLGTCRQGAECIVIREKWNMAPDVAGLTYVGGSPTTIHLNGTKRGMGWGQRYNTMIHELGHARGIYTHDDRCNSVMYRSTNCNDGVGRVAPRIFTAAEKRILRKH